MTVSAVLPASYVHTRGHIPATIMFSYDNIKTPAVIGLTIRSKSGPVKWEISRELLANGLDHATGLGDIRLQPRGRTLTMTLTTDKGSATFKLHRVKTRGFLELTYRILRKGGEWGRIDWDGEMKRITKAA